MYKGVSRARCDGTSLRVIECTHREPLRARSNSQSTCFRIDPCRLSGKNNKGLKVHMVISVMREDHSNEGCMFLLTMATKLGIADVAGGITETQFSSQLQTRHSC